MNLILHKMDKSLAYTIYRSMNPLIPILGLIISTIFQFVSLWQVEIVSWNADENFEFPFFSFVVNKWWARDFWYGVNILGWILMGVSAYFLALNL